MSQAVLLGEKFSWLPVGTDGAWICKDSMSGSRLDHPGASRRRDLFITGCFEGMPGV